MAKPTFYTYLDKIIRTRNDPHTNLTPTKDPRFFVLRIQSLNFSTTHLHGNPAGVPVGRDGGEDDKLDGVQLDGVEGRVGLAALAVQLRLDVLHVGVVLFYLNNYTFFLRKAGTVRYLCTQIGLPYRT